MAAAGQPSFLLDCCSRLLLSWAGKRASIACFRRTHTPGMIIGAHMRSGILRGTAPKPMPTKRQLAYCGVRLYEFTFTMSAVALRPVTPRLCRYRTLVRRSSAAAQKPTLNKTTSSSRLHALQLATTLGLAHGRSHFCRAKDILCCAKDILCTNGNLLTGACFCMQPASDAYA